MVSFNPRAIAFLLLVVVTCFSSVSYAKKVPLINYAQLPDAKNLRLSPGGTKLALVTRIASEKENGTAVQVTSFKTKKSRVVLFTDNTKYFLGDIYWKDDKLLIAEVWYPSDRQHQPAGYYRLSVETRDRRIKIIDTDTGKVSVPLGRKILRDYKIVPSDLGRVVDTLPDDPDHLLMSVSSLHNGYPAAPALYKVNWKKHSRDLLEGPSTSLGGWKMDVDGNVRAAHWGEGADNEVRIKDKKTNEWRTVWKYQDFADDAVRFSGFGKTPNIAYIKAYRNDYLALYKVDLTDPKLTRELVYADDEHDVFGRLVYSPKSKEVIGLSGTIETGSVFFDGEFKALQAGIDKALPDTNNYIYSITDDENKYLVYSTSPTESGTYYLGQRSPAKLDALAYAYKGLPPQVLAEVDSFTYKARDGFEIEGFLTLPKGVKAKKLPAVVLPHGGPWSRNSGGFSYLSQFIASRGYAVLQMNFRGSVGNGLKFFKSGFKKWGKEMQEDIEDGVTDLVKKGVIDPKNICIAGGSYGGYTALMGVVKTPDFYQCAISLNGVSDVLELVKDNREFRRSYSALDEMIGDDRQHLKDISPLYNVKKIKAPVLLIHGVLDRQVDVKHSDTMFEALKKADKPVEYIKQENEDHYLVAEESRVEVLTAVEAFLAENLRN